MQLFENIRWQSLQSPGPNKYRKNFEFIQKKEPRIAFAAVSREKFKPLKVKKIRTPGVGAYEV